MDTIRRLARRTLGFRIQKAEFADTSRRQGLCTAELAECTCPDFCERDHDID